MKTCKEMAMAIYNGDTQAKVELEKMMGCKLEDMTDTQKELGVAMLCVFESQWRK